MPHVRSVAATSNIDSKELKLVSVTVQCDVFTD